MTRETIADGGRSSIAATASACTRYAENEEHCTDLQDARWFGLLCHQIWPTKPWLMLMQRAGVKERTAHDYADGATVPRADVLVAMLRSVEGYRVLGAIMKPDSPQWWLVLQHEVQLAMLARDIFNQIGKKLKQ